MNLSVVGLSPSKTGDRKVPICFSVHACKYLEVVQCQEIFVTIEFTYIA